MRFRAKSPRSRRGATAVEMAFVSPWFFLLVLGMIEFSWAMKAHNGIRWATRQGARAGCLPSGSYDDVVNTTRSALAKTLLPNTDTFTVSVFIIDSTSGASTTVTNNTTFAIAKDQHKYASICVTASTPYSNVQILPWRWSFLSNKTLSDTTAEFRRED